MFLSIFRYTLILLLLCASFSAHVAVASTLKNQAIIDAFYLSREGSPLWVKSSKLNKEGKALLGVLSESWQNGLNPDSYHVNKISKILGKRNRFDKDRAIEVELLLTEGYVSYVQDLSGMRINARDMGLNPRHWQQRIGANEALSLIPKKDIKSFLSSREPQTRTYQRLKSEIITLMEDYKAAPYDKNKLVFRGVVKPNRGHNDIPKLRAYFGLDEVEQHNRHLYDDTLVHAVMKFQSDNGLKPDGIIGKQTLRALNRSKLDKIKQIIVNMERLRWVSDVKPPRFVVVNIPSATLWAIYNGKVVIEMPVIIGRKKRPTNSFITNIHGVRFNPTWTIPPTIKKEDILPQLQNDPSYLADKGIELYDGYDKNAPTLDPFALDWENISEDELHGLRMVQIPSKTNPLGNIRILMPNEHNIYLHDTNHQSLFYRADRAKSSGCVRMKYPKKIASFALENRRNWSEDAMNEVLKAGKMKDVYTSEKTPVYLLYYTTWLGDKNQIIYGFDVYNHDDMLLKLLGKLDGFNIMGDTDNRIVWLVDN